MFQWVFYKEFLVLWYEAIFLRGICDKDEPDDAPRNTAQCYNISWFILFAKRLVLLPEI